MYLSERQFRGKRSKMTSPNAGQEYVRIVAYGHKTFINIPVEKPLSKVIGYKNDEAVIEFLYYGDVETEDKYYSQRLFKLTGTVDKLNEYLSPKDYEVVKKKDDYIIQKIEREEE